MPETELTPGQETPPAETPPVTPSSEETPPAPETPAASISGEEETPAAPAEVPAAPTAEKTPEQIAADKVYFQEEARKAKEELSALKVAPPETPPPAEPAAPIVPVTQPPLAAPQPDAGQDVNEYLRDNPLAGLSAMTDHIVQHIDKKFEVRDQQREFQSQQREANRVLTNFCANNDISREELSAAHEYVKDSGVNGSPVAITSTIIDRLQFQKLVGSGQQVVMDAAAKAAAAAKAQALTIQPDGAQPATPGKPTTPEEIVRSKFKPSPQKVKIDEILGNTG